MELIQTTKRLGVHTKPSQGNSKQRPNRRRKQALLWKSSYGINGKTYHLGCFETERHAMMAYDNAAFYVRQFREKKSCLLNFPGDYEGDDRWLPNERTRVILSDLKFGGCAVTNTAKKAAREIVISLVQKFADTVGCSTTAFDIEAEVEAVAHTLDTYL